MGNTVNGRLVWNRLMERYEGTIRNAFKLHYRFIKMANRKMDDIRKTFLKSYNTPTRQANETVLRRKKKFPELVYVGIHVR